VELWWCEVVAAVNRLAMNCAMCRFAGSLPHCQKNHGGNENSL